MTSRFGVAMLHLRGGCLAVETASGVFGGGEEVEDGVWEGLFTKDPDGIFRIIPWSSEDFDIGERVRAAMIATRLGVPEPAAWANGIGSDKAEQNRLLASHFGLSDTKRLFTGMKYCCASLERGQISIMPTKRGHGGWFQPFEEPWKAEHPDVVVPASVSDAELGAAVRLGFGRCL